MTNRLKLVAILLTSICLYSCKENSNSKAKVENKDITVEIPVIASDWKHIFNPNTSRSEIDTTWYTNDHSFGKGADGKWHAYGIIGHEPINPWKETDLFHATSDVLFQEKWEDKGDAMTAKKGVEKVMWAPHLFQENGKNYLFYNIGNLQESAPNYASWGQLCMAESTDI